ncbi:hypothetical protein FBU59_006439 [Linderina macrospora]|uniref:Uncharacterized protein n=1 Tax=Linderina macrospora TaxID=4868 RepID=A0ACC1J017_9FUNG|nr:hypothetical protein FBU59_006439 [Linderina macrospora]
MEKNDAYTTATTLGGRTQFEREKERLVIEINQGLDILNRNFIQLNQNLESAVALGKNFDRVAQLWSEFGEIINPPVYDDAAEDEEMEEEDTERARAADSEILANN